MVNTSWQEHTLNLYLTHSTSLFPSLLLSSSCYGCCLRDTRVKTGGLVLGYTLIHLFTLQLNYTSCHRDIVVAGRIKVLLTQIQTMTMSFLFPSEFMCDCSTIWSKPIYSQLYCHCRHYPAAWKSHQEILGGESLSSSVNTEQCSDKFADEVGHSKVAVHLSFLPSPYTHGCIL